MIVNSEFKFIFVHIPKNAGTSIRSVLDQFSGNEPLLVSRSTKHETYSEFSKHLNTRLFIRNFVNTCFYQNPPISSALINDFTVIAVSRHPADRVFSLFRYLKTIKHPSVKKFVNFSEFVDGLIEDEQSIQRLHSVRPQSHFLPFEKSYCAIIKYENIVKDQRIQLEKLGIDFRVPLRNKSKEFGKDEIPGTDIAKIEWYYLDDFITFGYPMEKK